MEKTVNLLHQGLAFAVVLAFLAIQTNGQSSNNAICTGAMISNFGPCISFLTSGSNRSSPSSDCCNALKSLMSNGQDCLCSIFTGGSYLQIPINQTLAMSLPRACHTSGVPIECKGPDSPVPSPGKPGQRGSSPGLFPPPSTGQFPPQTPSTPSTTPGGINVITPGALVPTLTPPGMRPTLTLSAADSSRNASPHLLVALLGVILLNYN